MPSSREIARVVAPAPKRSVISRCIRRMDSLLVGIPHSIDCDREVDAGSTLTRETSPPAGRPIHSRGRFRQNGGRNQIGMLDGIRSERWTQSAQNAWTASVRARTLPAAKHLLCGVCGRRLGVRYTGDGGIYPIYQCVWRHREALAPQACLSVPAGPLDQSITERLVSAITPVTIGLALAALTNLELRDHEIRAQWRMRIERARYEVDLAERRYEAVDPANRLIAATLEQRWNDAMQRLQEPRNRVGNLRTTNHARRDGRAEATDPPTRQRLPQAVGSVYHD
jgi:hypothetical protein